MLRVPTSSYLASFVISLVVAASTSSAQDETVANELPKSVEPYVEQAAARLAETLWLGMQNVGPSDDSVSLLKVVTRLRRAGYGAEASAAGAAERGGRRGGQGRGGQVGGGNRGGSNHGGGGHGGGAPTDAEQVRQRFKSRDLDRDGQWNQDEINDYMRDHPASSDGIVTLKEFEQAWEVLRARMASRAGGRDQRGQGSGRDQRGQSGRGHAGGHGRGGAGRGHGSAGDGHGSAGGRDVAAVDDQDGLMSDAEFLVSLDGNRDRLITKPELVAAVRADLTVRLQERNNDGQVSPAELTTNVEQRLQRRGAAIAIVLGLGDLDADGAGMVDMTELAGPDKIGAELSEVLGLGEGRSLALTELYDRLRQVTADEESRLLSGLQAR